MVDGASAELAIELFGAEAPEVVDGVRPQVEHVVSRKGVSLFDNHHLTAQQSQLNGSPQATGTPTDNQTLKERERKIMINNFL